MFSKAYYYSTKQTLSESAIHYVFALFFCFLGSYAQADSTKDNLVGTGSLKSDENFSESDTTYINTLLHLAEKQRFYNSDSLYLLAKKALQLSKKSDYVIGQSKAYTQLGNYYSDNGQHDKGIDNYEYAAELANEIDDSFLRLGAINDLAGEFAYKGDNAMALKLYLEGIELAELVTDMNMQSILTENIAELYVSQKDFEQAMKFYKKVKKINDEIGDPVFMAETMSNMASAYADMGELDQAMFNVNSSIRIFEKQKKMAWLAYAYEIKGKVYLKKQKYNWAMYWYKQSELIHENLEDKRAEIALLNGMAEANLGAKNDSISEIYANKALELSTKLDYMSGTKDCSKILYTINKNKGDYKKALYFHELFQELSDTLSRSENQKSLTLLKTKFEYDQQKEQLILDNNKALAKQKMYVYATLLVLTIFLCIIFLIRRNEKIQKKLNKELLSKQADLERSEIHLKEVNQTKNKLFSIIGHDLRGPIGAFQGLIKLFKEGEMNKEEFLGFVPKLKTDIDNIAFTLNNLLSWGQTQMNGSFTTPGITSLEHIVSENIGLLSEMASSKSITFINKIEPNTITYSDSNQIDIVIRNLLSNALKFTFENGTITIGAVQKSQYWEVHVRDTGVGMDEETLGKIFNKDSTHSTYGTNDEKGTGLGLSLCKEMVEKNKGIIWADSAPNIGSSFYFTIPKAKKEYQKSA
ncbi:ATP-binding protein [Maribacter chungangensis]|uniref:histidine kinase n=1 Tax=Maribacter chungangensis TaxID=1069117 RepID=A0ABW3B3E0_9FLAO